MSTICERDFGDFSNLKFQPTPIYETSHWISLPCRWTVEVFHGPSHDSWWFNLIRFGPISPLPQKFLKCSRTLPEPVNPGPTLNCYEFLLHYLYFPKKAEDRSRAGSKFVGSSTWLNCLITYMLYAGVNEFNSLLPACRKSATTSPPLVEAWKLPAYLYTQTSSQVQTDSFIYKYIYIGVVVMIVDGTRKTSTNFPYRSD